MTEFKLSKDLVKRVSKLAWELRPELVSLAQDIHAYAEPAFQEYQSCERLINFLSAHGFHVQRNLAGLNTAFRAWAGRPGKVPALAFLAEMDALPGLGHACGHNLIAGSSAGAAVILKCLLESRDCRIEVIGCPAEESGGGKVRLTQAGVFHGLEAALMVHPHTRTEVFKRSLGLVEVSLEFHGRAAHAAAEPYLGINALDAVVQTFNAVNALRQQLPEEVRVHGVITSSGGAPNVIPDYAATLYLARGTTRGQTLQVAQKVVDCARGAALSTRTRLKARIRKEQMYDPFLPHRVLGRVFWQALESLGLKVEQGPEDKELGSTDVGNVSQVVPTIHPTIAIAGLRAAAHSLEFAAASASPAGMEMMLAAAKALALTGAAVLSDAALRRNIRAEFRAMKRAASAGA